MLESRTYIATPPGATIKEQLEDRGMTQKEFAARMRMSEKHASELINGKVHLTPDMAERLELVLGLPASFWNGLEAIYQEKLAKVLRENEQDQEKELVKKYPYNKLAEWGMVPATRKAGERRNYLCKFFEVTSLSLVESRPLMPIACRKLANTEKSFYSLLTLAQYAKIKARDIETAPFAREKLENCLDDIRALTRHSRMDFEDALTEIFRSCGIALVYLPQLPGAFLHGITFYDNHKIVLGITMRGKYADKFWFSLLHEISHILCGHIYQADGVSEEDEKEADVMAARLLLPQEKLDAFYKVGDFSMSAVQAFAGQIGVSEGIVIGRMQHDGVIPQDRYNQYKVKYDSVA